MPPAIFLCPQRLCENIHRVAGVAAARAESALHDADIVLQVYHFRPWGNLGHIKCVGLYLHIGNRARYLHNVLNIVDRLGSRHPLLIRYSPHLHYILLLRTYANR